MSEVARDFSEYIDRVAFLGERCLLTRRGTPVAELGPPPRSVTVRHLPSLLAGLPSLAVDDATAFAERAR